MIVLDSNVISELLRPVLEPRVETWLAAQDAASVYLTSIAEAELRYGVAAMQEGKRQRVLSKALDRVLKVLFGGRILTFGSDNAVAYAAIAAGRCAAGRPISQFDCQIAAICLANGAILATRNTRDFERCAISVVDPWR